MSTTTVPDASPRLFLVSDIHVDAPENWAWLEQLSATAYQHDGLIIAGDVSADIQLLEDALRLLKGKFEYVFFTPGNHELWVDEEDGDSMAKTSAILELCDRLGVTTRPCRFGDAIPSDGEGTCHEGIWVCPLLSFHSQSFDTEPDVQGWAVPTAEETMVDYRACVWPAPLSMLDDSVAAAVDRMNDAYWAVGEKPAELAAPLGERAVEARRWLDAQRWAERTDSEPLVTFSHFLPRQELLPEKRFLFIPALPKASGSTYLAARVAALKPTVHCFGHSHFGWDLTLDDGVRYIQAALSSPSERLTRWHTLSIGAFGRAGPLLIWSRDAGFAPKMHCRWSAFYEHHERVRVSDGRTEFQLARYAANPHPNHHRNLMAVRHGVPTGQVCSALCPDRQAGRGHRARLQS